MPNHTYGHGRIDALAAVQAAQGLLVPALSGGGLLALGLALALAGSLRAQRRARPR